MTSEKEEQPLSEITKEPDIGKEISQARTAKGMTQEELAAALNVSRPTVANWETGRRLPDVLTMRKISSLLHMETDEKIQADPPKQEKEAAAPGNVASDPQSATEPEENHEVPQTAVQSGVALEAPLPPTQSDLEQKAISPGGKFLDGKHKWFLPAVILVTVIAVVWVVLANRTVVAPFTAESGQKYMPDDFKAITSRLADEPYLDIISAVSKVSGETGSFVQYAFAFNEINGYDFFITSLEGVCFGSHGVNQTYLFHANDLEQYNLGKIIEANGNWNFIGGYPEQDGIIGIGILMTGHGSSGNELVFTAYQPM